MNFYQLLTLLLLIFSINTFANRDNDSCISCKKQEFFRIGVGSNIDIPGPILSVNYTYSKQRLSFSYGYDYFAKDYIHLQQIDYKGFLQQLNSGYAGIGLLFANKKFGCINYVGLTGNYVRFNQLKIKDSSQGIYYNNNEQIFYKNMFKFGLKYESNFYYKITKIFWVGISLSMHFNSYYKYYGLQFSMYITPTFKN